MANAWFPGSSVLRLEPESEYIGSHVGDYALKGAIERAVPVQEGILVCGDGERIDRDIVVGYESTQGIGMRRFRTPRRPIQGSGQRRSRQSQRGSDSC